MRPFSQMVFKFLLPAHIPPIYQIRKLRLRKVGTKDPATCISLNLCLGYLRSPVLEALPVGHGIGIQINLEKWPQAILKATGTHHLLLALKNSHFSHLPTTHSQVSGWLSSPWLDMWVPDVHSIASSCAFACCRRYHMPTSTHLTSGEQGPQEKKHLTGY